ncbi:hypothetical protein KPH14_011901 [Odynerus spinipes]|uniref:ZAD domain-containing protein n=1 Tax=Odynerus spinipes TaxID=1348599 RepID=A0AAD9R9E5_9HYME|nr:hypothetical protein KPH14_011901 [Odynerus spinipes]
MTKYCFLCLSDEGVFLNVTPNNYKSLCGEVETYLPVKIEYKNKKTNNVCHKCAYELKQCSDFVKKCKESHTNLEQKHSKKQCCSLCLESARKGYIFKLNEDNDLLNNLLSKFEKLFDGNLAKVNKSALICLTCRYSLDILFDLTFLCQEISKLKEKFNKDIDYSVIPKVDTTIIRRKTTTTSFIRTRTYCINDSDSESNITENQTTAEMNKDLPSKSRLCGQCHHSVKHGEDMYRFHRTGLTVCKSCWTSIDLNKHSTRKNKQKTNTKLCTVFLKDVFADTTLKKQKVYRVEKDSYGNQVFIVTESESEVEIDDKVKISKEPEKIQRRARKRSKSKAESNASDNDTDSLKKMKVDEQNTRNSLQLRELPLRSSAKRAPPRSNHYSDTDILPKRSLRNNKTDARKRRNTSISFASEVDTDKRRIRKRISSILEDLEPLQDDNTSENSLISEGSKKEKNADENKRRRITRSSSTNTNESLPELKNSKSEKLSKTSGKKSKLPVKETSPNKTDVDEMNTEVNNEYTCSKCGVIHENKLVAAKHELTHSKQLKLKLHKISLEDKLEDEQQADESSTKHLIDELAEQQNEEITLSVNDDEDFETVDITEHAIKSPYKEKHFSSTENQGKDSVQLHVANKESTEKSKVTETIEEPVHEESTKTDEHEINTSKIITQSELTPTSMEEGKAHLEDAKSDQIQNGSFKTDKVKNKQEEIDKDTVDKDNNAKDEDLKSSESENINMEVIDEDKSTENENAKNIENEDAKSTENENTKIIENEDAKSTENEDAKSTENENAKSTENENVKNTKNENVKSTENENAKSTENENAKSTENESIELQQNDIEVIDDILNEVKANEDNKSDENKIEGKGDKIHEKEDKTDEIEKDKTEKIEATEEEQKEEHNDINVKDDQKDLNANTAELNDTTNIKKVESDNLSQEEQKIAEDADDGNDKIETYVKTVNNITSENNIDNSVSTCNIKLKKDNCHSSEEETKDVKTACTKRVQEESKRIKDTEILLSNLENVNSSESVTNEEANVIRKTDKESTNAVTEMVEHIFDLVVDELDNRQSNGDQDKKYNDMEAETLENISREIQRSADMPSLDPISSMEVDHKELV